MKKQPQIQPTIFVMSDDREDDTVCKYLRSFLRVKTFSNVADFFSLQSHWRPDLLICTAGDPEILDELLIAKKECGLHHISILWSPTNLTPTDAEIISSYEKGIRYVAGGQVSNLEFLLAKIRGELKTEAILARYYQRKALLGLERLADRYSDDDLMNSVNEYLLMNNLDKDFSITKMGSDLGMSRTNFFSKIKGLAGMSPSKLVMVYRLKKAAILLEEKAGNVTDIAYRVGFSSTAYFAKCFKDQYGTKPSLYLTSSTSALV
jgi:AraC-like DNA-binding protein